MKFYHFKRHKNVQYWSGFRHKPTQKHLLFLDHVFYEWSTSLCVNALPINSAVVIPKCHGPVRQKTATWRLRNILYKCTDDDDPAYIRQAFPLYFPACTARKLGWLQCLVVRHEQKLTPKLLRLFLPPTHFYVLQKRAHPVYTCQLTLRILQSISGARSHMCCCYKCKLGTKV